jgi:hypothetical protein
MCWNVTLIFENTELNAAVNFWKGSETKQFNKDEIGHNVHMSILRITYTHGDCFFGFR